MNADNRPRVLEEDQALLAAEVFRMLADPTRVRLLWALIGSELPVNDLAARVGKSGPAVSQHLAKLRMARMVRTRRVGTSVYYRVADDHIEQMVTDAVHSAEHFSSETPAHHAVASGAGTAVPPQRAQASRVEVTE